MKVAWQPAAPTALKLSMSKTGPQLHSYHNCKIDKVQSGPPTSARRRPPTKSEMGPQLQTRQPPVHPSLWKVYTNQ